MIDSDIFKDRSIVVYISYAPAGFGHLRVADAFYHGLPEYVTPVLLGTTDTSVVLAHRLTSVHPLLRMVFVWSQNSWRERIFTIIYRRYLHSTAKNIKHQLVETISQRIDPVKTIVIVATHYGIAHQVSYIKLELEKALSVKIILVVQVTDDSPQLIWYVRHSDMIFMPSDKTKEVFEKYDKRKKENRPQLIVSPYPVSPLLGKMLSNKEYERRIAQLTPDHEREIHMIVPLSGAAVGLNSIERIMDFLHHNAPRFLFHVIAKDAPYTKRFIERMEKHKAFVKLYTSKNDKEIVNMYEDVYMKEVVSLEITKPSEQAFKALYYPKQRGGSILLFATPVGRQEYDNLDFLRRHRLIPSDTEQAALFEFAKLPQVDKTSAMYKVLLVTSKNWRGFVLPEDSLDAGRFILWCLENGFFAHMAKHEKPKQHPPHYDNELSPNGVEQFWMSVSEYVKEHSV